MFLLSRLKGFFLPKSSANCAARLPILERTYARYNTIDIDREFRAVIAGTPASLRNFLVPCSMITTAHRPTAWANAKFCSDKSNR